MTQAEIFADLMRAVWDGGVLDENGKSKYGTYHDANCVADAMGAKRTGQSSREEDDPDTSTWHEYLFADGSVEWVLVNSDGCGVGTTHASP